MTTRQNEVKRILTKLNGHAPDDAVVSRMANIAEAVEITPGDALFPLMIALDSYLVTYESIPERIKEASAFILREHSEAFRAEAAKITEEQKGRIEETTKRLLLASTQWLEQVLPAIVRGELEKAAATAVNEPVKAAAERFEKATRVAEQGLRTLREAGQSNMAAWAAVVFAGALLGGAIGGVSMEWGIKHIAPKLTPEQQNIMTWGEATGKVFNNLPPQAQKMLMDAANGK
jgi:hypothetical protein